MPSSRVLSDAFRAHPLKLHHKFLDLSSLTELPETHTWAPQLADDCDSEDTPIVDLDDENANEVIGHACKSWGVFQVINHNIPKELMEEAELAAVRLFSLPMHKKLRAAREPDGVSGYGLARISSFFPKLMWSEGFTILGSPQEHARVLWPDDYEKFCDTIENYEKALKKLADRLMWLMLGQLGIMADDIKWASPKFEPEPGLSALQLNHYPPCPDPARAMGLAVHTDSTLLTILHQSNTSGLQVLRDNGSCRRWTTVAPLPGAMVVHVGDLLHILSNGIYPSVVHRVVVNRNRRRFSIAYLYGPPLSVKIGPADKLIDECHPPLYRPITWTEYLGTKAKYFDKALTSVRICSVDNKKG